MIVATRTLRLIGDDGDVEVPVSIHMPVEDDRCWRCDFEIGWPSAPRRSSAYGVDAVQALQLVMFNIGIELMVSQWHAAGQLIFEDADPAYGFPAELPPSVGREDMGKAG